MKISTNDWKNFISRLSALDAKAGELMQKWIQQNGFSDTEALIDYAYALITKYGEGSAALSAFMYDTVAEAQGATIPPAVVASTPTRDEVQRMINGVRNWSMNPNSVSSAVSRLVKRTGADTTLRNAERDGAEFAWVPSGDTCAFCITLASNGWQRQSKKAMDGGHAKHIHANCDCTYAVRFDGKSGVKGYDPEVYREMYYGAEGDTPKERVNSIRRMKYEANREKIRAQKRAAYAVRKENAMIDNGGVGGDNNTMRKRDQDDPIAYITEDIIDKQFGYDIQRAVYLTDERIGHINENHPGAYDALGQHIPNAITNPDMVLKSHSDKETAMFIKRVNESGLAVMVKVAQSQNRSDRTFVKTMYPVGTRSINKLKRKNQIVYVSDKT